MLPAAFSPVLVNYLKRCLHKDRKQRIRDIGDVSLALAGAFETARHVHRHGRSRTLCGDARSRLR